MAFGGGSVGCHAGDEKGCSPATGPHIVGSGGQSRDFKCAVLFDGDAGRIVGGSAKQDKHAVRQRLSVHHDDLAEDVDAGVWSLVINGCAGGEVQIGSASAKTALT